MVTPMPMAQTNSIVIIEQTWIEKNILAKPSNRSDDRESDNRMFLY